MKIHQLDLEKYKILVDVSEGHSINFTSPRDNMQKVARNSIIIRTPSLKQSNSEHMPKENNTIYVANGKRYMRLA